MSEGHQNDVSCSASTSASENCSKDHQNVQKEERLPSFCVNEMPWKLVPQVFDDESCEYDYLDTNEKRVTDVESFVWKWSPCGRYGIDLPGGRDFINQQLKDRLAVFDLHTNTWTFYVMDTFHFEIPRVCFLYWARHDIICAISLIKDSNHGPDDEILLKFKQSFYYICHETHTLEHVGSCKYTTNKTIVASYWYHIFENRLGEPFVDHNKDLWLVFSNGKDALILLPFLPTQFVYEAKCVSFEMNDIVSKIIGTRVYMDPFVSSHFVPFIYRNDANFFLRIDSYSFQEENNRDYGQDPDIQDETTKAQRGVFQMRINLSDVIRRGENEMGPVGDLHQIVTRFGRDDVNLWRKIAEDSLHGHECFTQHGKTVVLQKWAHSSIDMNLSKKLSTRVANLDLRANCCSTVSREFSYCSIDLDNEQIKKFDSVILGTDVVIPHPSGSVFMFRYKEDYGMSYCELPYFPPLSLYIKCFQTASNCVEIDPNYYSLKCCLKTTEKEADAVVDGLGAIKI